MLVHLHRQCCCHDNQNEGVTPGNGYTDTPTGGHSYSYDGQKLGEVGRSRPTYFYIGLMICRVSDRLIWLGCI